MTGLANTFGTCISYSSQGISNASDAEPVIVTPCRAISEAGRTAIRDRVFAGRCEFSWRSETVSTPSGDGRRTLVFKRLKQTANFERASLHAQSLDIGDLITRSWDGATFTVSAIYRQSDRVLCDLTEINPKMQ